MRPQPDPSNSNGSRGRVLVVDDEPGLLRAYQRHLQTAGYQVCAAHSGAEAMQCFAQGDVDAVLTDISMPGMDGMELLKRIREANVDVPVVIATAGPSVETAIQAMDHGALKYLVKPVDPKNLIEIMERAVHLNRMAQMKREAMALLGDVDERLSDRSELEAAFTRAMDELHLFYQPIVQASTRAVYGFEALVRSREPALPHPGALFEAAEKLNRVQDLGHAIRLIAPQPIEQTDALLFINLHPKDLTDDRLLANDSVLANVANRVVLEITERASLEQVPDARNRIASLRELGYRIAVDDLGAGYAGLTSFALLEPDVAKLDMAIVRDVHRIPTKQKLIHSMSDLCRDMGIQLVAEGVETIEELHALMELGCDLFQGYYFARPAPPFPEVNWW